MESNVLNERPRTVTIEVHNEDTGKQIKLEGESTDLVQRGKVPHFLCIRSLRSKKSGRKSVVLRLG